MTYRCRECKVQHDTLEAGRRCKCGASLDESIRIAEKERLEQERDEAADKVRRGEAWT